ncbi:MULTISPECIES: DNA-directed RNA polymerase subunit epsilon [unclassified Virgibacillus]|uniref:DNA-dependent RNA polymerase subunit epsilon n=1 Tax=unclassified Virgibacillus TaxID=2620237 RepID=UPI0024DEA135|nr:DNA-directed RNA polymerase subunit epsilon [Virgibacillus sp. LDC-1]
MIFKVLYQESMHQVPVREHTKSLYIEAESNREARKKIIDRNYNIEFIQPLEGAHLDYEKKSEHFSVEKV